MQAAEIKTILATLALPPAGPLLLVFFGLLLLAGRWRRTGFAACLAGAGSLWFLSCNAIATALAHGILPPTRPITEAELRTVQAIVVLGSGVEPQGAEYGAPQPNHYTFARLRHGVWLARKTKLPLGFAGGVGWAASGTGVAAEGTVVQRVAREEYGVTLRWLDDASRDTKENAERMAALLRKDGVKRIALVTDSWHMPRSVRHFRAQGLEVLEAPIGFPGWRDQAVLEWLPSGHGLQSSRQVLREWLALQLLPPSAPGSSP